MPKLTWIGKDAVEKHHQDVPTHLLEPVPELSCGDSDSGNLIVQGDNLIALKALLPRYAGKVKCIYIDPPYNTGNEGWAYNDNVNSPEIKKWLGKVVGAEAEDLSRHDKWLCMMYPRLVLLKQFLREDGVIFVSIDDNEQANLKLLMDEIFGGRNFISTIVWEKRYSPQNAVKWFSESHDFVIVYAKNKLNWYPNLLERSDEMNARYRNLDNDSRGVWKPADSTAQAGHGTKSQFYILTAPNGKQHTLPNGRCWLYTEPVFQQMVADNRIWFGANGNNVPAVKRFLSEVKQGMACQTIWKYVDVGHNQEGKKEINDIFPESSVFDTPKPSRLINRIIQLATDKNAIVLDTFAGSGTTAHAVLKLNEQDGGNRQFVLVEMDEDIAKSVTAERNKRVIEGYENAKGEQVAGLGGGFQFCRLSDEPLFAADGEVRADVTFAQLASYVWFNETKIGYEGKGDSPLLGVFEGRAIYLLYNGILKDKKPEGGNILTRTVFDALPKFDGQKVIYAAAYQGGVNWIKKEQIIFKQTPYALETTI
jgi:site-specific DNA-methyltransferase (adenine-specific)/adenine-specific DNA-methyltransferase